MSESCNNDCANCEQDCSEFDPKDLIETPHASSHFGKVIAIMSGKGGVGKSAVAAQLAVAMSRLGKRVGILDADITGPSIPQAFNIHSKAVGDENGIIPESTKNGIEIMSLNLLLQEESDPVVWRGAVLAGAVKQFWTDVIWGDLDYLFIDMPPGTGDVPLTVFQSIPVDGIIVVTSPQDLVSMIVTKAVKMANLMKKPILGIVENYSYFECPNCKEKHFIFGESRIHEVAKELEIPVLAQIPIDPTVAAAVDAGAIETYENNYLSEVAARLDAAQ
ncbi:MAG: Mrp/NBP35 family ATP-binding protein [Evtepia sp.]